MSAPSPTDLMYEISYNPRFVPHRSHKVNVSAMTVDGEKTYIMKNHATGTYFSLSEFAHDVWNLIDGKRSIAEIITEAQSIWLGTVFRPNLIQEAILFYAEKGALKAALEPVKKSRIRVVSAFEVDVSVVDRSKGVVSTIHRAVGPLLRRPLLWLSLAFIVISALAFAGHFASIFGDKRNFQILGSSVVGFFFYTLMALMPVHIIHELAHGIALYHYGGTPGEMGTGLFYFSPMFYVDTTDAWTLTRRQRIMVYMAGMISTLLIGSTIVVVGYVWQYPPFISHTLYMIAFYCFLMSLINLAPPFETDGYYVLCDLVKIPSLRQDAYNYLKTVVRRVFGKPVEELEELTGRKKKSLLGYAILSATWIAYIAFQTSTFTVYMAQDTASFAINIFSAILFAQPLTTITVIVSLSTFVYFAMTMVGYGFMLVAAVKKATAGVLKFEAIHDRDLSVFLYLPAGVPKSVANKLKTRMAKVAEKITPNFDVKFVGPLCRAVLRIGGTRLPRVQIREHLRNVELRFRLMYQKFLERHKPEILGSVGIYGRQKADLTTLLKEMAEETGVSAPEAKAAVNQIIDTQARTAFYLLNSAFGTAWTIELPPAQQRDIQQELLSTLSIEDLAITDLYDEVEDFKKRIIYGFDSLAKLVTETQNSLQRTLAQPEKYHAVSLFEPIKGRLIFVGRTEEIEEDLSALGSLFVCQVWCGYLDNLLNETNLALSTLKAAPLPSEENIKLMKDGEPLVLNKNLTRFLANEKTINNSLEEAEKHLQYASLSLDRLKERLKPTGSFEVGILEVILAANAENLKNLPRRFKKFKETFPELCFRARKMKDLVEKEHTKRRRAFLKKKRGMLTIYPLAVVLSIALGLMSVPFGISVMAVPFLAAALLTQVVFWTVYSRMWRSFHSAGRYPSLAFNQIQLFLLAFTQAIYKFVTTGDILTPTGAMVGPKPSEPQNNRSAESAN